MVIYLVVSGPVQLDELNPSTHKPSVLRCVEQLEYMYSQPQTTSEIKLGGLLDSFESTAQTNLIQL